MKCGSGRYVFSVLACLGNMICLLGRDTMRLAILPMQEELHFSPGDVSHVLGNSDGTRDMFTVQRCFQVVTVTGW